MSATDKALGFVCVEAIREGRLDEHLDAIAYAIKSRRAIFDHKKSPPRTADMISQGQVWAWMNGPGTPHWEVCGTGALL